MTTYSIYAKANDATAADAVFVPDAFSWGAFVFSWIWALWNRMWIVGVVLLAIAALAAELPLPQKIILTLAINLFMGLHGNDLLGWSLKRRGLAEIGLSHGSSLEEAELRFYADEVEPAVVDAPLKPLDHDTLGLFGARS